jgi:hypothetical protein
MVLDDVTDDAGLLVESRPVLDADRLADRDLDMVDVGVVPDGLEDRVGEAEREDVLDGLLAQVVVDAEDLALRERPVDDVGSRALARSWPNGFSMTTRANPGGLLSFVAPIACTITGKKLAGVER